MAVFRVEKSKDFTVISNIPLRDQNLTYKARGLLAFMLSLPDEWDYSINGLVAISKENKTAIKGILNELEENGYLERIKLFPKETKSGRIEYVYQIYESPKKKKEKQEHKKQDIENPALENLHIEKQEIETQPQINTKRTSTKEINTKKTNTKEKRSTADAGFHIPSKKFIKEIVFDYSDNEEIRQTLIDFLEMRKKIRAPMTDRALELMLTKLDKMTDSETEKIAILEQSIERSWRGIFPLKEKGENNANQHSGAQTGSKRTDEEKMQYLEDEAKRMGLNVV